MKKAIVYIIIILFLITILYCFIINNEKTGQFSIWKKINYPEDCLKNYCDIIDIKTYNFDFCVYAEVNKQEHLKYWVNFNFYEDRIITSDIMQRREHYIFKSDCDYLVWEKIYNNQKSF